MQFRDRAKYHLRVRHSHRSTQAQDPVGTMNPDFEIKTMVLRDLQSLLRQNLGQSLIVTKYKTDSLLPPGENYGSTILSVHATIKKNEDAEEEDLFLIAKMAPPTDYQKRIFDSPFTFRKESYMYEIILPAYNQLERECGLKDDELFKLLPKFYGMRLSLDPNVEFDDDAVMLLENLKTKGYYTGKRAIGYDLEHSKHAIRAMARFHALGMAMKYKKPDMFEVFKYRSKCIDFENNNDMQASNEILLKKMKEDPEMNVYYEKAVELFNPEVMLKAWKDPPNEPWSTIIHSDFWVNNILFHRGEDGKVDDVKFVDFQNYLFFSPLRELVFYLFSSVDDNVHENHIEELIDLYHKTFIDVLTRMRCDTTNFTREKFDAQLPKDGKIEFIHLTFMLKVLTLDTKETNMNYNGIQNFITHYEGNKLFEERLRRLVAYFGKHNWL